MEIQSEVKQAYIPVCLKIFLECEKDEQDIKYVLNLLREAIGNDEEYDEFLMDFIYSMDLEIKEK